MTAKSLVTLRNDIRFGTPTRWMAGLIMSIRSRNGWCETAVFFIRETCRRFWQKKAVGTTPGHSLKKWVPKDVLCGKNVEIINERDFLLSCQGK
jgi:hypothetical protein